MPIDKLDRRVAEAFYGKVKQLYPHQEHAIETILSGQNIILSAGTGSGKTEAVLAPLTQMHRQSALETDSTTILYIAPTKALANDIEKRLELPLQHVGLRVGVRHGDKDALKQKNLPHVLITTPESLDVLLFRADKAIQTVKAIVIDEVHLFYNTQRGLHLSILIRRLEILNQQPLQFACLSATVGNLAHIRDFMFGAERACHFVKAATQRTIASHIRILNTESDFVRVIEKQCSIPKTKLLIFANSRKDCEHLANLLHKNKVLEGGVFTHYSSLSNDVRQKVEHDFANHPSAICISTSTLELGIDIGDIDMVILYGAPRDVESLLQRIGRSNRRHQQTNVAAFVPETSQHPARDALGLVTLMTLAQEGAMPQKAPYALYGAAVQQGLSMIGARDGSYTRIADIAETTSHLQHLDRPTIEKILAATASGGYLRPHGFKNQYGGAEKLYQLIDYRLIYGNFPQSSREIPIMNGAQVLGHVPIDNLMRIGHGDTIRFAGNVWLVQRANTEEIRVVPSERNTSPIDISYSGSWQNLSAFLVHHMWHFIHNGKLHSGDLLKSTYERLEQLISTIQNACQLTDLPMIQDVPHAKTAYLTFGGIAINHAIGLLLIPDNYTANEFAVLLPKHIKWRIPSDKAAFERVLPLLFTHLQQEAEATLYQKILPAPLAFQEAMQFWHSDAEIDTILQRLSASALKTVTWDVFQAFLPS